MPKPSRHKGESMTRGLRRFLRDERGLTALYIGLAAPLLFGITALAFDLGRVASLQSELQSAADAAALAGAAELDRQTGAITRASKAAGCPGSSVSGAFGTNDQTFATDGAGTGVSVAFCVFFSTLNAPGALLPPNISAQGGSATNSDNIAAYIKVVVQQRSIANAFITLVGGPQIASTTATATAGKFTITCKPLQLMICNPAETLPVPPFSPQPGQEIFMPYTGGQFQAPGDWGLMDTPPTVSSAAQACGVSPGANGTPPVSAYLGSAAPVGCFATDSLFTRPGKPTPVAPAINTVFDLYNTQFTSSTSSCFPPSPDVVKGMDGAACNPNVDTPPGAEAFPQDSNFAFSGLLGNGNWDYNTYWSDNHLVNLANPVPAASTIQSSATTYAQSNGLPAPGPLTVVGGNTIPSRYAVYLYEIANQAIPAPGTPLGHLENGAPACYFQPSDPNITPSRRFFNLGLVNCNQQNVTGHKPITPYQILQAFVMKPADTNGFYFEVVKTITADQGDGILHNVVQLYR